MGQRDRPRYNELTDSTTVRARLRNWPFTSVMEVLETWWPLTGVNFLFSDARSLYGDVLEMLEQGKIRNAAEKAWGATKRAIDALVLAKTSEEPPTTALTTEGLLALARAADDIREPGRPLLHSHQLPARVLLLRRDMRSGHGAPDPADSRLHPGRRAAGNKPLTDVVSSLRFVPGVVASSPTPGYTPLRQGGNKQNT